MLAYLVIREGTKWSDVFRLVPGRAVTIGRAQTNDIVIKEEGCSRQHAEITMEKDRWSVRDLGSRNGTFVGKERINGQFQLSPGDVIRIGHTQLAFVNDLSKASEARFASSEVDETVGQFVEPAGESEAQDAAEPTITHRRHETKFLNAVEAVDAAPSTPKVGRAATKLCRLAFELANAVDSGSASHLALDGLFESTSADAGAVLLAPRDLDGTPTAADLELVASRADERPTYQRVSNALGDAVLRDGEAVLARNVEGDSTLGIRDSKGEIHATSVICAPIRQDGKTIGLIHLYSTQPGRVFDPDDLEFTLAVADNVALALKNLRRQQALAERLSVTKNEIAQLRNQLGSESELVGSSELMRQVHHEIARAAPSRATVLIRGESGVGKELVARAAHYASSRAKGPFVCLNCAALSETLLESELFGHEKGAFTGATDRKIGKFEAADKGTLLLDEIGEMSASVQAKFLRVLEGHPFERVGGSKAIKADVRVIAATNRDLEKAVTEGKFRKDLYFRLHVVEIFVPPLRKRPKDIVELAEYFLKRFNAETGRKIKGFLPEAIQQMRAYRWPGNVRELKNVIERAVVLARGVFIEPDDLNLTNLTASSESNVMPSRGVYQPLSLADVERRHILATLNETNWNKSRTASILGIERSTLDRKIRRYNLGPKPPPVQQND